MNMEYRNGIQLLQQQVWSHRWREFSWEVVVGLRICSVARVFESHNDTSNVIIVHERAVSLRYFVVKRHA